jgi:hypothetical protein
VPPEGDEEGEDQVEYTPKRSKRAKRQPASAAKTARNESNNALPVSTTKHRTNRLTLKAVPVQSGDKAETAKATPTKMVRSGKTVAEEVTSSEGEGDIEGSGDEEDDGEGDPEQVAEDAGGEGVVREEANDTDDVDKNGDDDDDDVEMASNDPSNVSGDDRQVEDALRAGGDEQGALPPDIPNGDQESEEMNKGGPADRTNEDEENEKAVRRAMVDRRVLGIG